jgi:hypothetical protein
MMGTRRITTIRNKVEKALAATGESITMAQDRTHYLPTEHVSATPDQAGEAIASEKKRSPSATLASPPLPPLLMMAFWMLLGGAAGINLTQSTWRLLGLGVGEIAIAVPVGGVAGAIAGALLGLITNPRSLMLLMAVFAGSAAGAVAGKLPWGAIGEIGGQVAGGLLGGITWAAWLFIGRDRNDRNKKTEHDSERS